MTVPAEPKVISDETWMSKELGLLRYHLSKLPAEARARVQSSFVMDLVADTFTVGTPSGELTFVLLGRTAADRAITLLTKQPGTIEWIDNFAPDSVFWDVGANIGAYTLYAALRGVRVVAIEPAAVNYYILAANCEANHLDSRVDCLLLGLGDAPRVGRLPLSQFASGKSFSFRGKRDRPYDTTQSALILPMDDLIEQYGLPCPNYIKIDTPGMTSSIIAGAARTLRRPEVREIHVELKEHSAGGTRTLEILETNGFAIVRRDAHGSTDLTFARRETPGR